MLSATADNAMPMPRTSSGRSDRPHTARPSATSASSAMSPTGYARFTLVASVPPDALSATGCTTAATPTAAVARPAMTPSSHIAALSPRDRAAISITRAAAAGG